MCIYLRKVREFATENLLFIAEYCQIKHWYQKAHNNVIKLSNQQNVIQLTDSSNTLQRRETRHSAIDCDAGVVLDVPSADTQQKQMKDKDNHKVTVRDHIVAFIMGDPFDSKLTKIAKHTFTQ